MTVFLTHLSADMKSGGDRVDRYNPGRRLADRTQEC